MKLIVSGATGFVGSEVIRQCLSNPKITSILAMSRRPVSLPDPVDVGENADPSKLKALIVEDFTQYPENIKSQLADADACIWTIAVLPTKSKTMPWEEVKLVCQDYTLAMLNAVAEARQSRRTTFRFMYMSGFRAPRDLSNKQINPGDYILMRGEIENQVLAFAADHKDAGFEACVAKPGFIVERERNTKNVSTTAVSRPGGPSVGVSECAAAMIDQVLNGFEKEPLTNDDLNRLGLQAMQ